MDDLSERAALILRRNDRGGYSVPSDGLYPFQWNWDSGFAAMGYGCFDEVRAWRELARLLEGQWQDGMVPHIVFHREDPRYFPGPDVWGTTRRPPTSGISQPPILAVAARWLLAHARDRDGARAAVRALWPKFLAYHRWYHGARDPEGSGLVSLYHPWETGMDNSPAWDGPLGRVPVDPLPPYERRDTGHVDPSQRPQQAEYDRYLTLLYRFRARGWDPQALYAESPFRIADVGVNAILHRADRELLALARDLDVADGRDQLEGWIERSREAIGTLWSDALGGYRSRDQLSGEVLAVATSASFLPLFAGAVPAARAAALCATLERWAGRVRFLLPSTDPGSPLFEARRYWRGPVWLIVNWMIADGLLAYGRADLADRLRDDALELVRRHGFFEYFDPVTGDGLGGADFTWTAAATLFWKPYQRS